MKFLKGLKNKLVSTAKDYVKRKATKKITKLLLKSRPEAAALVEIAQLAADIRRGRK